MQDKSPVITPESVSFLKQCCGLVASCESETFSMDVWHTADKIVSPIEQALFIAMKTVARLAYLGDASPVDIGGAIFLSGVAIKPQYPIGKYTIDFLVSAYTIARTEELKQDVRNVLVECDSQMWHERTEAERRYEKSRDRYLNKCGYTVFHYTGAEILRRPLWVASEIIGHIAGKDQDEIYSCVDFYISEFTPGQHE